MLFLGSGFDTMDMIERPCGESQWTPNMTAHGVNGVLMRFMGRMGWVCGKMSRRVVGNFPVIPDLRQKMSLKLDSSMTSATRIRSLKDIFLDL